MFKGNLVLLKISRVIGLQLEAWVLEWNHTFTYAYVIDNEDYVVSEDVFFKNGKSSLVFVNCFGSWTKQPWQKSLNKINKTKSESPMLSVRESGRLYPNNWVGPRKKHICICRMTFSFYELWQKCIVWNKKKFHSLKYETGADKRKRICVGCRTIPDEYIFPTQTSFELFEILVDFIQFRDVGCKFEICQKGMEIVGNLSVVIEVKEGIKLMKEFNKSSTNDEDYEYFLKIDTKYRADYPLFNKSNLIRLWVRIICVFFLKNLSGPN